jgi:hypothetical protein
MSHGLGNYQDKGCKGVCEVGKNQECMGVDLPLECEGVKLKIKSDRSTTVEC